MISRKSAKLIADAYDMHFSNRQHLVKLLRPTGYLLNREKLYDFLYEEEYEAWFLNIIRNLSNLVNPRILIEHIMGIHTGETLINATKDWTWEARRSLGQRYLRELAEDLFNLYAGIPDRPPMNVDPTNKMQRDLAARIKYLDKPATLILEKLKSQLELDGYILKEGVLYRVESSVIDEQEEQTYLEHLVAKVSLSNETVIKHHIKLAEEHYVNGKWEDSIANSRKFLEAILAQVADAYNLKKYAANLNANKLSRPVEVREYLEREKLIESKEKKAIAETYGLLSGTGSHPYIAEKDQARLMWHLALTFSQFVLLRYEGFLKNNP